MLGTNQELVCEPETRNSNSINYEKVSFWPQRWIQFINKDKESTCEARARRFDWIKIRRFRIMSKDQECTQMKERSKDCILFTFQQSLHTNQGQDIYILMKDQMMIYVWQTGDLNPKSDIFRALRCRCPMEWVESKLASKALNLQIFVGSFWQIRWQRLVLDGRFLLFVWILCESCVGRSLLLCEFQSNFWRPSVRHYRSLSPFCVGSCWR